MNVEQSSFSGVVLNVSRLVGIKEIIGSKMFGKSRDMSWCKGLGRALGLPWRTHSALLALVTGTLPLMDELLCQTAMFVSKCLTSDNSLVNFVARHGVYVLRQNSPVGSNALGAV